MRFVCRSALFLAEFLRIAVTIRSHHVTQIQIAFVQYNSCFLRFMLFFNTIHAFYDAIHAFYCTVHAQNVTLIPFQIKWPVHELCCCVIEYDSAMIQTAA